MFPSPSAHWLTSPIEHFFESRHVPNYLKKVPDIDDVHIAAALITDQIHTAIEKISDTRTAVVGTSMSAEECDDRGIRLQV